MNTFLPYADYEEALASLDSVRLANQRRESFQLVSALKNRLLKTEIPGRRSFADHVAAQAWIGHEKSLVDYSLFACVEHERRGGEDNLMGWFLSVRNLWPKTGTPPWLGWHLYHARMRQNLVRKDPEYYSKFDDEPAEGYIWPFFDKVWYAKDHPSGNIYTLIENEWRLA